MRTLYRPASAFDGDQLHAGWSVLVEDDRIAALGADVAASDATLVKLGNATLLPGLIDLHTPESFRTARMRASSNFS